MDLGHSPDTGASEGELRPPRILKTSLFLQKGGPRKEPSQRTATALFYLIPCGDLQLSPREFYLSLIIQGTVRASELIRALQRGGRPSSLARTISEIGRIAKTLHLLAYIDDEAYRRRILRQINRGEGRHSVARAVFFGKRGELRRRYKRGAGRSARRAGPRRQCDRALEHALHGCGTEQAAGRWRRNCGRRCPATLAARPQAPELPRSVPLLPSRGRQRRGTARATGPERWT